jgi:peptide/nickel transport system permease protein
MARFLIRRALFAVLLVVASSSTALVLTRLAPGDLTASLGPFAPRGEVAATRARFDLDRSLVSQWSRWARRAARLDFGDSFLYNRPVTPLVLRATANTAALGVAALAVATILGLGLGVFSGSRSSGLGPAAVRGASLTFVSLPPMLVSLGLVFVAARTGWLPAGGMSSASAIDATLGAWLADVAWHLPVPMLALALPMAATFERLQAQSMAEAVHQPFLVAAVARGAPRRTLILRHAWPVSLRSIFAVYGLAVGALLSGSFIVEHVTAWPGLGRLMYEALRARDIYLVSGCAAMGACFLAVGTLLGDVLLALTDPRVRTGQHA